MTRRRNEALERIRARLRENRPAGETPVVVFLQNAWSPFYAGGKWPRASWLAALAGSRSGRRLRLLIPDPDRCENTTPIVGATPGSKVPPDPEHITNVLERRRPRVVVACGRQAEAALVRLWEGPLLVVPHPAARVLTDALYRQARRMLDAGLEERIALRQRRGHVERVAVPQPGRP